MTNFYFSKAYLFPEKSDFLLLLSGCMTLMNSIYRNFQARYLVFFRVFGFGNLEVLKTKSKF